METDSPYIRIKLKSEWQHARNPTHGPLQPKQLEPGGIWGYLRKRTKTANKPHTINRKTNPEKIEHRNKDKTNKNKITHAAEYTQTQHEQIHWGRTPHMAKITENKWKCKYAYYEPIPKAAQTIQRHLYTKHTKQCHLIQTMRNNAPTVTKRYQT